jgi:hypothetical protein
MIERVQDESIDMYAKYINNYAKSNLIYEEYCECETFIQTLEVRIFSENSMKFRITHNTLIGGIQKITTE